MNRKFAWFLAACSAGISSASAAVLSVPLSAVPISAPAFSAAVPIAAPTLFQRAPVLASAPSLTTAPLAFAAASAPAAPAAQRFDGEVSAQPAAVAVSGPRPLGAGLKAVDPADEAWLARVVLTMSHSRTARRILRDIADLAEKNGNPTLVVVKRISNNGEFRYDSDLLVMDAAHRRRLPEQTAPIFAHELQHVLQRAKGLPVNALELEIESYTEENKVWSQLGVEPPKRSFARQARQKLLKDPDEFFLWLAVQYDNNRPLHESTVAAYVAWLKETRPKLDRREKRAKKELAATQRVVVKMREEGKSEDAVRAFIEEDVEPVERRLRGLAAERAWNDRDLALLSTKEGRDRFQKYSRGVIRRARSLSRTPSAI